VPQEDKKPDDQTPSDAQQRSCACERGDGKECRESVSRDLKDLRELLAQRTAYAVEASPGFRNEKRFSELVDSGRVVKRDLPDGRFILQCESTIATPARVRKVNQADRIVTDVTMSDETVDRYRDIIRVSGWKLKDFRKYGPMLIDHDYSIAALTGLWNNARKESGPPALLADGHFDAEGMNDTADMTFRKILAGSVWAVSVGFRPWDWARMEDPDDGTFIGYEFTEQDLWECSWVAVPANPNALRSVEGLGRTHSHPETGASSVTSGLKAMNAHVDARLLLARATARRNE